MEATYVFDGLPETVTDALLYLQLIYDDKVVARAGEVHVYV